MVRNCSVAMAEPKNYGENMIHSVVMDGSSKEDPAELVKTSTNDIKDSGGKSFWVDKQKKSWADMAEEEEQDLTDPPAHLWDNSPRRTSSYQTPTRSFHGAYHEDEEGFNDENLDINIVGHSSHERTLMENLSRTLTFSGLECGSKSQMMDISPRSLGRSAVRRSLNFNQIQKQELNSVMLLESKKADGGSLQGNNRSSDAVVPVKKVGQTRRKRLQVFQDITRLPHTT
ncbi:hypothetical protein NL676_009017 [Syzygium grande]|nr:hypothetical protein NL676_009017 [Syzygium grande]